jgi:uncharacterized protein (TIGR00730 family)
VAVAAVIAPALPAIEAPVASRQRASVAAKTSAAPSSTVHRATGRAAVDARDPVAAHRAQLKADLGVALDTLATMPPALTFFGGARIKSDDPYYAVSQQIGRLLAERGVPPRTGAGPGIMQSVPEGYVQHRDALRERGLDPAPSAQLRDIDGVSDKASLDDVRTQGFNIKLPHEQKLNPVIEVAKEIQLFPFRKLALYENARGVVTFPGGFGTIDELFEIWALSATNRLSDPLAAVGVEFWKPTLAALKKVAVDERKLIDPEVFARLFVTDDPHALLDHMLGAPSSPTESSSAAEAGTSSSPTESSSLASTATADDGRPRGFEQEVGRLKKTLAREVDLAAKTMATLPPAVAFLGGEALSKGDPTLSVAAGIASAVVGRGTAVRVGDGGAGSQAVVDAAAAAGADHAQQQSIVWEHDGVSDLHGPSPAATFTERIPHKELLLRSAEAYVVLPAGLKGLDEMATVLCQMQTGKLPKRPLVLVGSDYWRPILAAFEQTMITPERRLIAPEDMQLFTVVDTVEQAKDALTNLR